MKNEIPFVPENSLVREIWGDADFILLIFAGSAAEFALHKQVDWLYFTGKLPKDPIKRLFSTVEYAAKIVFSSASKAQNALSQINQIHHQVEVNRGSKIPNWAYLDVLSMLIDYSIKSFEIWKRTLTQAEKEEIYEVFKNIANGMQLHNLPDNYVAWEIKRVSNLENNYAYTRYTKNLFEQYFKHLGWFRYWLLLQIQSQLLDPNLQKMLNANPQPLAYPLIQIYKGLKYLKLEKHVKSLLIPKAHQSDFQLLFATKT
ncbi:MAG: DUF2236 domain-containing protein [Pedobacter sp.]|nr:MAG: DUF2236 domain-containing protein [Pedobacter sp.]